MRPANQTGAGRTPVTSQVDNFNVHTRLRARRPPLTKARVPQLKIEPVGFQVTMPAVCSFFQQGRCRYGGKWLNSAKLEAGCDKLQLEMVKVARALLT